MYGQNDHPDQDLNKALTDLCEAMIRWERGTGRSCVFVYRENNGEMPGDSMTEPGYAFRAVNGIPLEPEYDLADSILLSPFVVKDLT